MTQFSNKYNLEERTAKYGERIISLCNDIRLNPINSPIVNQ